MGDRYGNDAHPPTARRARRRPRRDPSGAGDALLLLALPESPSPRVYGERVAAEGLAAHEAHLGQPYGALLGQPTDGTLVGSEVSPYGPRSGATYPALDLDAAIEAAQRPYPRGATPGPRCGPPSASRSSTGSTVAASSSRTPSCTRPGQPFVMSFQAGGPHAQDRAIEAVAAGSSSRSGCRERRVGEAGQGPRGQPGAAADAEGLPVLPRGVALVIGCNTFPTWNAYPGIFASLVTGNPVVVKPHPRAVLPSRSRSRSHAGARGGRLRPALVQLAAEADDQFLAVTLAERDEVAIIDYTGGPDLRCLARAGGRRGGQARLHREGRHQHDRRRLDRRPSGRARQPRLLADALLRPHVHRAAEHLRARGRCRHQRGPPVLRRLR